MKVKVKVLTEIELKVDDEVIVDFGTRYEDRVRITKLAETRYGQYAALSNSTWRPMSTYGVTWIKAV